MQIGRCDGDQRTGKVVVQRSGGEYSMQTVSVKGSVLSGFHFYRFYFANIGKTVISLFFQGTILQPYNMIFTNRYVLAIIILLLIGGAAFLFNKSKDPKSVIGRRKYRTLEKDTSYSSPNTQDVYQLSSYGDSLFVLTKNMGMLIDSNLKQESKVFDQNPQGRFSYHDGSRYEAATFDAKAGILRVSSWRGPQEYKTYSTTRNALYMGGDFYFDYVSTDSEGNQIAEIRAWSSSSGRVRTVAYLSDLLWSYIDRKQGCMSSQLEGNFFAIDHETWGYVFYHGSFIVFGNEGTVQIGNSIFNKGFVSYTAKPAYRGGTTGLECKARNESRYYYDAYFHEGKLYALSGVAGKPGHADIDVYNGEKFKYLYTLTTPLKTENSYARTMEFVGNSLYLASNDGEIIKFSKFEQ